ncbi:MAG: hypothetical protein HYX68_22900 [Planctomycetes bacterium]|nr:hypothetical protein [Planctomycetota bacterium]
MAFSLGIRFPSEADAIRKQVQAQAGKSPGQKFLAALDVLDVAEKFSRAGTIRLEQLKIHARLEEDWQRRMKEFIKQHVAD